LDRTGVGLRHLPETLAVARALATLPAALDQELAATRHQFWQSRFDAAAAIINRAVTRAEVPAGTDPHELLEFLVAPAYFRVLLTGEPLDAGFIETAVKRATRAFAGGGAEQ
jgi:hypothetical protein